jgi:hypothetical protein
MHAFHFNHHRKRLVELNQSFDINTCDFGLINGI